MNTTGREFFFRTPDGREAGLYTIERGGLTASLTDFGGALTTLLAPDRDGRLRDVVLGHDAPEDYIANNSYLGSLVGRYANRIRGGRFTLDGKEYFLVKNEKRRTSLHGGDGFSGRLWRVVRRSSYSITLAISSPDGDAGFPGRLELEVTYSLTEDAALRIDYAATSDADTPVNFTNHAYFNLDGGGDIAGHEMSIAADYYCEVNASLIPTGRMLRVDGTPFDLRRPKLLAGVIAALPGGIDHNYAIDKRCSGMASPCATAFSPASGIALECFTTEPGVQLYMGGGMTSRCSLKGGKKGFPFAGFCLETQHYPDSPNHPEFPSTILRKGEKFRSSTLYRFKNR